MDKYQEFVDKYSDKYKGLAKNVVLFMKDKDVSSLMGDELYEYFGTKTTLSKTQFYVKRKILKEYVEFINVPNEDKIINCILQVSQSQLAKRINECASTYRNLDELLELLNQIVLESELHSTDASPLQSMAIMVWLGYSDIDITEIKSSDIDNIDNLDNKYKDILKTYADLKYFRALPTGRVQNLAHSDYLFRTANTNKLTERDVRKIISKINSLVAQKGKTFTRVALKKSSAFCEMYDRYKLDISADVVRQYFGQSKKKAEIDKLIIEYNKWAENFKVNILAYC